MDLKEKIKLLPEVPGVYLMKDFSGNIIYVGKSKNLKNRVSQYFQSSRNHPPKIVKMVQGIRDFEFITTDTEFEALLLECRLIKEIKPIYNSQMKNHRSYVYLKISIKEEYPRILVAEDVIDDGSLYFGPYTSQGSAERAASAIRDTYKIGNCSTISISKNRSGCLNYQMGLCLGACADPSLSEEYLKRVKEIVAFLSGKENRIFSIIEQKMLEAAEELNFDKAAKYRDDILALKHIVNKQRVINFTQRSRNIIAIEYINTTSIKVFLLCNNKLFYEEKMNISKVTEEAFRGLLKEIITTHFNTNRINPSKKLDKEDIDQAQIVFSYLKNNKDCIYSLIPDTWLKNGEKLEKGIEKFISKLFI